MGDPIATTTVREASLTRGIQTDSATGNTVWEISADNGEVRFESSQLQMSSNNLQRYSIHPGDPLTAKAEYQWEWVYLRDKEWRTKTFTRTEITCDQHHFFLKAECIAWEGDEKVFSRSWDNKYLRDHF